MQAEAHTCSLRVQELQHKLTDMDRLVNMDKQALQRQIYNLQNLLTAQRLPVNAPDGTSVSSGDLDLLRDERAEPARARTAMSQGLANLCEQRNKEVEAVEVRACAPWAWTASKGESGQPPTP